MCFIKSGLECGKCPFVTCHNNPQFYFALQCALRMYQERARASASAGKG